MRYYSLKRQLIVHYGLTAFGTVATVVLLGSLSALYARGVVQRETSRFLEEQLSQTLKDSSRQTADLYHKRFTSIRGSVSILSEILQDRFDDRQRVFVDQSTRQNVYPLEASLDFVPFDWQLELELELEQELEQDDEMDTTMTTTTTTMMINGTTGNGGRRLRHHRKRHKLRRLSMHETTLQQDNTMGHDHDHDHGDDEDHIRHDIHQQNGHTNTDWYQIQNMSVITQAYSLASPFWFVAGSCDPSATSPTDRGYLPNCPVPAPVAPEEPGVEVGIYDGNNNNVTLPFNSTTTTTNSSARLPTPPSTASPPIFTNMPDDLRRKATDVAPFLKALWEAEVSILHVGIFFFNDAKGATMLFPSLELPDSGYISAGCDWLLTSINPYTQTPYGTASQIQNHCHPNGTYVNIKKHYNPMERSFCQDQIAHPGESRIFGPYMDALLPHRWRMTVGQAVFDRYTGEFLACTALELNVDVLQAVNVISEMGGTLEATDIVVLRPDGTVVSVGGGLWDHVMDDYKDVSMHHIARTNFIEEDVWELMIQQFEEAGGKDDVSGSIDKNSISSTYRCNTVRRIYSLSATEYGDFYVLVSAYIDDAYGQVLDDIDEDIEEQVFSFLWTTAFVGLAGLLVFLIMVRWVAVILTRPLLYMERVAWKIVNHNTTGNGPSIVLAKSHIAGTISDDDDDDDNMDNDDDDDQHQQDSDNKNLAAVSAADEMMFHMDDETLHQNPVMKCTPKTEISELVEEFQVMIRGFSGTGASRAARASTGEIKNMVTWKDPIQTLYDLNPKVQERLQQEQAKSAAQAFGRRLSWQLPMSTGYSMDDSNNEEDISGMFRSATLPNTSHDSATQSTPPTSNPPPANTTNSSNSGPLLGNTFYGSKPRTNLGSNVISSSVCDRGDKKKKNSFKGNGNDDDDDDDDDAVMRIHRSSLFRWILGCIALPLLLTIVIISAIVALELLNSFPKLFAKGSVASFDLAVDGMQRTAALRASQAEQVLPGAVRDLHLLNRVAGWLLFGALNHSNTFTEADIRLVEECKTLPIEALCPYQTDITRSPCDCKWNDPWNRQCRNFPAGSRHLQRTFFICQARDVDPVTGYRNASLSFPQFDNSPDTTLWWTNVAEMPGANQSASADVTSRFGYATTYDRARVSSALSVAIFPIYNYVSTDKFQVAHTSMSSYLAFEADGAYSGYSGCNDDFSQYAHFKSSGFNRAYIADPDLCPIGKYGYDPRCRMWYTVTRDKGMYQGVGLHVTAPYQFATVEDVGTTAASPLIDTETGEYVGTTAVDFEVSELLPLDMDQSESSYYFVISPDPSFEADTVVGPDFPIGSSPRPIADVILPNDDEDSENRAVFQTIVDEMKLGDFGEAEFYRTTNDGRSSKKQKISYAPVYARALIPINPSDYAQSVNVSKVLLYSVGIVRTEEELNAAFEANQDYISEQLELTTVVYLVSVALVTFICILIAAKISVNVTRPMMILLQIVQRVNSRRIEDDLPPLAGGSREANQIYTSFAKLYKIVRMSNSSFFSGDFKWAHHIATDALKLFTKIEDEKAIAIASNNVCNTLVALGMQRREKGNCMVVDSCCCVNMAIKHINEAIDSANREFDGAECDSVKAEFAQQLGDRHFNRAMCLLHCLDDPCCPQNARDIAYADLIRCRDYDNGVREFFMHERLMFKYSDVCYDRVIRRLHGLASLFSIDKAVWQIWDVNDLIDQADTMLQAAWDQEEAPLFRCMTPVGRLQQLEGAVINLELVSGKVEEAARLAMRMLVEDEYLLDMSFGFAASSVLRYISEQKESPWPNEAITRTRKEFRKMRKTAKRTALDIGTCYIFCVEITEKLQDTTFRSVLSRELLAFYDEQCGYMDSVGLVALSNSVESNLILRVGTREQDESNQQDTIRKATRELATSTSYPALPTAVNMVVAAARSKAHDVILVYISDGSISESTAFQKMQTKIEKASRRQRASIDVMAIGLGVPENSEFAENCEKLCLAARSRHSRFFSAVDADELEEVFENVGALNSSVKSSPDSNRIQLGITMERF